MSRVRVSARGARRERGEVRGERKGGARGCEGSARGDVRETDVKGSAAEGGGARGSRKGTARKAQGESEGVRTQGRLEFRIKSMLGHILGRSGTLWEALGTLSVGILVGSSCLDQLAHRAC